jgi:hypothetical protein
MPMTILIIQLLFIYLSVYNNNNPVQVFIIYVRSQQLQSQVQTEHNIDTGSYIMDKHNIKTKNKLQESTGEKNINA